MFSVTIEIPKSLKPCNFFKVEGEIDIIMEAHSNMNLLTKMHTTLLFISREEKIKFMHILTR